MASRKSTITRLPTSGDLIGPWDSLLSALKEIIKDEDATKKIDVGIRKAKQQAILLNQKLENLQDVNDDTTQLFTEVQTTVASIVTNVNNVTNNVSAGNSIQLPMVGPSASISGASYLAVTQEVPLPIMTWGKDMYLVFPWLAGGSGVNAQWRLRDRRNSTTIASGSKAAPFTNTHESKLIPAASMPAAGARICLEFCFSGATSGQIGLYGPGQMVWV